MRMGMRIEKKQNVLNKVRRVGSSRVVVLQVTLYLRTGCPIHNGALKLKALSEQR